VLDDNTIEAIKQKKLDSLAAKHLHVKERVVLNRLNRLVDCFAIAVPVLYFVPRFLAKGTRYANPVEIGWEILAAILLCLTAVKISFRWEERAQVHSKLLGENIFIAGQADELLLNIAKLTPESARGFLLLAGRSEIADREAIGEPPSKKKQFAYREALKEFESGNREICCPICNSSPWKFVAGSCQTCGNTPAPQKGSQ